MQKNHLQKIFLSLPFFLTIVIAVIFIIFLSIMYKKGYGEGSARSKLLVAEKQREHYLTENCNWLRLESMMNSQSYFSSSPDEKKDLETKAKSLEQRGLKPCNAIDERTFYLVPEDQKFWFKDIPPNIDNYLLIGDETLYKISDNLFTGISRQIKKPTKQSNNSFTYEWDSQQYTLLLVEIINNIPKIVSSHDIDIAKKIIGPYYLQISRTKWLTFNTDLTFCKIIDLKTNNNNYEFIEKSCQFDDQGKLLMN